MAGRSWSEEEKNFIKDNLDELSTLEIANKLKRTRRSVQHFCYNAGLSRTVLKNGDKVGRFTIEDIQMVQKRNQKMSIATCICSCGTKVKVPLTTLSNGLRKSCGCLRNEEAAKRGEKLLYKHGLSKNKLYFRWNSMRERCHNIKDVNYKNYGAKGITVCDEWKTNFKVFFDWAMVNGYSNELSLDRIDFLKGYSPDNCRWVTKVEQNNNKSSNVKITAFGETKNISQWLLDPRCKSTAFNIKYRLSQGYTAEDAISLPRYSNYKKKEKPKQKRKFKKRPKDLINKHPLRGRWLAIKNRCYNKKSISYKNYGGRGIIICDSWKDNFRNFYDWSLDNGYEEGLSLERINNDGNYEPDNCKWIPTIEQGNNKRNSHFIEAFGEQKTLAQWSRDSRCCAGNSINIANRIKAGWSPEKAISTKVKNKKV